MARCYLVGQPRRQAWSRWCSEAPAPAGLRSSLSSQRSAAHDGADRIAIDAAIGQRAEGMGDGRMPSGLPTPVETPMTTEGTPDTTRPSAAAWIGGEARRTSLDPFFRPRSVALIGATEHAGSVGRTLMWNLISSPFGGTVYPVNRSRSNVLGIRAYPAVGDLPEPAELAVIATPAPTVPGLVRECGAAGVTGIVVISAGFRETGADGAELERALLSEAHAAGIRVLGPNCLGVMNPIVGFNATFAAGIAAPGSVGFASQSGALVTAVLDWSLRESVGFSSIISLGSMVDVGWADVIDHRGDDPNTASILLYMETIGDARAFLSAAREVALAKPIIVIKPGRTDQAAKAAASHTGSLTGSDEVLDAAFRRVGVLRVDRISDLFGMADVLAKQPRPRGRRLTIVTNAGGPGVLATDALIQGGGELTALSDAVRAGYDRVLTPPWSHNNPVDIIGDAPPQRYADAVGIATGDPAADGVLVILTPQAMTDPAESAREVAARAAHAGKPILASWMGGPGVEAGVAILRRAGIPTFDHPDTAVRMFNYLWRSASDLRALYETPGLADEGLGTLQGRAAHATIAAAGRDGRTLLTEVESKAVLAAYGIPVTTTLVATTADAAVATAASLGYPVAVKVHSRSITHKSDVGGVCLNVRDEDQVRAAVREIEASVKAAVGPKAFDGVTIQPMVDRSGYELIVGSSTDSQLGPVLLFGAGGELVELFRDRSLGLPPLNTTLARRMIERTAIARALSGIRGRPPVNIAEVERLLVRFSRLVIEQPRIREIDINPLLASPAGLLALDARIVLNDWALADADLPRPAIRPYPQQYARPWTSDDGRVLTIRPIRPEDEPAMSIFHGELTDETVHARYFEFLGLPARIAHERLTRICFNDFDRELALVAVETTAAETPGIVAVGRLSKSHTAPDAEVAIVVVDRWQRHGLGAELLHRLVDIARTEGIRRVWAEMLPANSGMRRTVLDAGFTIADELFSPTVRGELLLDA
jgi:acetyltransferase